ncbi:7040_t:CDS:2 [Paraglomus occultum]|uniref:7040_t:CDS:1 n=1 Tax=Paraglomus occultum TaxID=144539 RepID=A0A9N9A7L5_9GLOM|nr:7040_t:CDS:2 [Paraglomus occultum]
MEPLQLRGQWNAVYLMVGTSVGHRDTLCDVNAFWNKIELNRQLQDQSQTAEVEATSSLISVSKKTFATTIRNVHSAVENVNDTFTLTITGNPKTRSAEEASPIVTPPPNLRDRSPSPSYYNGNNSLNDYDEESAEVSSDFFF